MGAQIIKQPDGKLAVFSTGVDGWIFWDATPEELIEHYRDEAARQAEQRITDIVKAVENNEARRIYAQFTMTFDEANAKHLENEGAELIDVGEFDMDGNKFPPRG